SPQGLSACGRPARGPRRGHRVPVVERLGCLCGLGIRDAGGVVQSLWPAIGAFARCPRSNDKIAGRAAGAGGRAVKMDVGAVPMSVNSGWKLACLCAISDGVPRRSLYVALVVGT